MKRIVRGVAVATVALAGLAIPAGAGVPAAEIEFGDDFFFPRTATADLNPNGVEGVWTRSLGSEGDHNVREDHRLFFSGPARNETEFNEFQASVSAGTWGYYCQTHATSSTAGDMRGRLRVRPRPGIGDGASAPVSWAEEDDTTGDRYEVQWRRQGTRRWKVWKRATPKPSGRFGLADNPVNASPDATYQVRARSFVAAKPKRGSRFSPVLSFSVADPFRQ